MASRKKTTKKTEEPVIATEPAEVLEEPQATTPVAEEPVIEAEEAPAVEEVKPKRNKKSETVKEKTPEPKHKIGSIVYISKDAEADLNGFKLFPQYKKYTYTVEAYDADRDVYTLRRLNLSLKLQSAFILAPSERAHDPLNRKQF